MRVESALGERSGVVSLGNLQLTILFTLSLFASFYFYLFIAKTLLLLFLTALQIIFIFTVFL
jgi:hypothetical protein